MAGPPLRQFAQLGGGNTGTAGRDLVAFVAATAHGRENRLLNEHTVPPSAQPRRVARNQVYCPISLDQPTKWFNDSARFDAQRHVSNATQFHLDIHTPRPRRTRRTANA